MERYFVGSWRIVNEKTGDTFYRKEMCRLKSTNNFDPNMSFNESIAKDHPGFIVERIRLKELNKEDFETVIEILGQDLLEVSESDN